MSLMNNFKKPKGFVGKIICNMMNKNHFRLYNWVLPLINIQKGDKILDAGCGGGRWIQLLLEKYEDAKIYGLDYSKDCIHVTKELNEAYVDKRCFISEGDILNMPYEDNTFSIVTSFESIYFWKDVDKGLSECFRVLKQGGTFILCLELVKDKNDKEIFIEKEIKEMTIYKEQEIIDKLQSASFTNIRVDKRESDYLFVALKP